LIYFQESLSLGACHSRKEFGYIERQFIHLVRNVDTHAMITISILHQQLVVSMCFVLSEKHSSRVIA
jgi:hypothetical protein